MLAKKLARGAKCSAATRLGDPPAASRWLRLLAPAASKCGYACSSKMTCCTQTRSTQGSSPWNSHPSQSIFRIARCPRPTYSRQLDALKLRGTNRKNGGSLALLRAPRVPSHVSIAHAAAMACTLSSNSGSPLEPTESTRHGEASTAAPERPQATLSSRRASCLEPLIRSRVGQMCAKLIAAGRPGNTPGRNASRPADCRLSSKRRAEGAGHVRVTMPRSASRSGIGGWWTSNASTMASVCRHLARLLRVAHLLPFIFGLAPPSAPSWRKKFLKGAKLRQIAWLTSTGYH